MDVQPAPDLVFNMTTKLAWLANFVAGACCNVPFVISNILAMFPACNGKQEAGGWKSRFCQVHT